MESSWHKCSCVTWVGHFFGSLEVH